MHIHWTCFVLILLEGEPGSMFLYRSTADRVSPDFWRLPGGERIPSDTDERHTLNRIVHRETGFNLRSKNSVRLFESEVERVRRRPHGVKPAKKYTIAERYYVVSVTAEEYITRKNFDIPENSHLELMGVPRLESGNGIYGPHTEVIRRFLATL